MVGLEGCLAGSSEGKSWDWRERHEIGKHFECYLEEFKPDVMGEFVWFVWLFVFFFYFLVLSSLECFKPLRSFGYLYFKIPTVGELISSWPFCIAATLFPLLSSDTGQGTGSSPSLVMWFSTY